MYVMQTEERRNNGILFKIITLVGFVLGLFLIIFLNQNKGKRSEQSKNTPEDRKGRVKNSTSMATHRRDQPLTESRKETLINKVLDLNQRQETILAKMQEEGEMEPNEIYELVPNVSTRTVRRDMDTLVEKELVKQQGSTKATTYIYTGS
jgi:predicted HTH transcriptional regulator